MNRFCEPFTYETAHLYFEYDRETGIVCHKRRTPDMYPLSYNPVRQCKIHNKRCAGKPVGCAIRQRGKRLSRFAAKWKGIIFSFTDPRTGVVSNTTSIHRLIWLMEHGYWPKQPIDHINGDPLDNRLENLRMVDYSVNSKNSAMYRSNTTGFTGVSVCGRKYRAQIRVNGKHINLGYFEKIEDAAAARALAEKQYGFHPEHGRRIEEDHGVEANDESSTTPSVCPRDDSTSKPVQGELSFL